MSELVPADQIEAIVGITRQDSEHYARAVSSEQTVYILHSRDCLNSGIDLRDCPFSLALDNGIDLDVWQELQDRPVHVMVDHAELVPHP